MTRAEVIQKVHGILEDIVDREIERFFDHHEYDAATEEAMRDEMGQWKAAQLVEIEKQMNAMVRSMLH